MQRTLIALLICTGFTLVFSTAVVHAQDDDDDPTQAEYYGEADCSDCHREFARSHEVTAHGLALQESDEEDAILADFSIGEDVRTVQFPGEDEARAFDADDIVYTLGAGRYAQRYIAELEDGTLAVLPAEWVTASGEWQPFDMGEAWLEGDAYDFLQNCAGCHTTGLDVEEGEWVDSGVQCESCHGPGSVHVDRADESSRRPDDEELAYIRGGIIVSPDAQVCGRCHSQGTHTESGLPVWLGFRPGYDNLLDGVELVAMDDPVHWWASGHARQTNMQFNEWLGSAHATALETMQESEFADDACLQCHSGDYTFAEGRIAYFEEEEKEGQPPQAITLSSAEFGLTCTSCHSAHMGPEDADFFLRDEPYAICTACHTDADASDGIHHPVQQMFEGQAFVANVEGVPSRHFSEDEGPECITCHMSDVPAGGLRLASHALAVVEPGNAEVDQLPDSCTQCHENLTGTDLQLLIDDTQDATRDRIATVFARVASVQDMELDEAEQAALDEAIAALTFVQNDGSLGVHNFAYVDELLTYSEQTLITLSVSEVSVEPTEGPAPTATPATEVAVAPVLEEEPERVTEGFRPITGIIMALTILALLIAGLAFFRKSSEQEV